MKKDGRWKISSRRQTQYIKNTKKSFEHYLTDKKTKNRDPEKLVNFRQLGKKFSLQENKPKRLYRSFEGAETET